MTILLSVLELQHCNNCISDHGVGSGDHVITVISGTDPMIMITVISGTDPVITATTDPVIIFPPFYLFIPKILCTFAFN